MIALRFVCILRASVRECRSALAGWDSIRLHAFAWELRTYNGRTTSMRISVSNARRFRFSSPSVLRSGSIISSVVLHVLGAHAVPKTLRQSLPFIATKGGTILCNSFLSDKIDCIATLQTQCRRSRKLCINPKAQGKLR